jgi:hypothetical protein
LSELQQGVKISSGSVLYILNSAYFEQRG